MVAGYLSRWLASEILRSAASKTLGASIRKATVIATRNAGPVHRLAVYVQAKFAQVEHIEDRLENLIWRQQARLQVRHTRLEAVREIKEVMGIHEPKV